MIGNDARRYLAEFIGTALLVIGGVGTAVLAPEAGPVGIALAFGLTLLALAYAIGPISGCHINPAVTFGMALSRRLSPRDALFYVLAQIVGGIAGAGVVSRSPATAAAIASPPMVWERTVGARTPPAATAWLRPPLRK